MTNPINQNSVTVRSIEKPSFEWTLPNEITHLILQLLPLKDWLAFDSVAKGWDSFSKDHWKWWVQYDRFDFDWKIAKDDTSSDKYRFRVGRAIDSYFEQRMDMLKKRLLDLTRLLNFFEKEIEFLPEFAYFVARDFAYLSKKYNVALPDHKNFTSPETQAIHASKTPGNLMLQGVLEIQGIFQESVPDIHHPNLPIAVQKLKRSIEGNATIASNIASIYITEPSAEQTLLDLSYAASEKNQDFRGLRTVLRGNPNLAIQEYDRGKRHPPILTIKASFTRDLSESEKLFDEAIKGFQRWIPVIELLKAGNIKETLEKPQEAEHIRKEAEVRFDRDLLRRGGQFSKDALLLGGIVKSALKKYEEAEFLLAQAQPLFGGRPPKEFLFQTAQVKYFLGKYGEAEPLYDQALPLYQTQASKQMVAQAAEVKLRLGKHEEAEPLYDRALMLYGAQAPKEMIAQAAEVKSNIDDKEIEADTLYDRALTLYGDLAPKELIAQAANAKFCIAEDEDAEPLYDRAIALYGAQASGEMLTEAAEIKYALGNYNDANNYIDRALALKCYKDPQLLLDLLVKIKRVFYKAPDIKAFRGWM